MTEMSGSQVFDSSEVSELVGVDLMLLNKFVENGSYGIRPSIRPGKGRGARRLFSTDDVLGIALVWWLFESGLRSRVVQLVLDQLCQPSRGVANEAAQRVLRRSEQLMYIYRTPRQIVRESRVKYPRMSVHLVRRNVQLATSADNIVLEIPVDIYSARLLERMKNLSHPKREE